MNNRCFKLVNLVLIVMTGSILSSCVTVPATKDDLYAYADVKRENIIVNGNYQSLLKCWNDKANKLMVDFSNATQTQVYPDLGYAEITAGGAGGYYYFIIELRKMSNNRTQINAFGNGSLGEKFIPEYIQLLQQCSRISTQ